MYVLVVSVAHHVGVARLLELVFRCLARGMVFSWVSCRVMRGRRTGRRGGNHGGGVRIARVQETHERGLVARTTATKS